MKDIFLILSGVISIGSLVPYIRDILNHKTKPNLVSWITWTLLTGIATSAEIGAGEYRTAIFTGFITLATGLVVVMGLRHGYVKYTQFDVVCQMAAVGGIILWQVFDSPLTAVWATIVIDFIGALPTMRHSWMKPYEETWQTYAIGAIACVLGLAALTSYNWISASYILYILAGNIVLTSIILYRRFSLPATASGV